MKLNKFLFIFIILIAFFFRFYGLNWDQNTHLHPDERFLTMVETGLSFPKSISEYLDSRISSLNPYNHGNSFYVYGTFPLFLTKYVGYFLRKEGYDSIHFVGRFLSGLFDLGTVFLLFFIGKKIKDEQTGLIAAFLYGTTVLAIQLSHFFAVDTFLNFFILLSFYFLIFLLSSYRHISISVLIGISLGLAMACKINAVLFLPIILLGIFLKFLNTFFSSRHKFNVFSLFTVNCFMLIVAIYLSFRFFQPTAFTNGNFFNFAINPQFISNLKELKSFDDPDGFFPPAIQWMSTKKNIFPLKNLLFWGMGLPLGILSLISSLYYLLITVLSLLKKKFLYVLTSKNLYLCLIPFWCFSFFLYQGSQFTKNMRYFIIIYPFLDLLSACFLSELFIFLKKSFISSHLSILNFMLYIIILIYPVSFMSIYTHNLSRVSASKWINTNIPDQSILSCDHWDDCLPVVSSKQFKIETLEIFSPDTSEKWHKITSQLEKIDYLILSSNRAWGSISKVPKKYPKTSEFYEDLFSDKLNFKKVAEFTSYPCFPPIGKPLFCFPDQSADESFTVYDHPKVMIFKKDNFRKVSY